MASVASHAAPTPGREGHCQSGHYLKIYCLLSPHQQADAGRGYKSIMAQGAHAYVGHIGCQGLHTVQVDSACSTVNWYCALLVLAVDRRTCCSTQQYFQNCVYWACSYFTCICATSLLRSLLCIVLQHLDNLMNATAFFHLSHV